MHLREIISQRVGRRKLIVVSNREPYVHSYAGEAMIVNPYDIDGFANAIKVSVEMPCNERESRMRKMRLAIEENNVYNRAVKVITELSRLP